MPVPERRKTPRSTRSIKTEFVFLVSTLIVIIMALSAIVSVSRERLLILNKTIEKGQVILEATANLCANYCSERIGLMRPYLKTLVSDPDVLWIGVKNNSGEVLLSIATPEYGSNGKKNRIEYVLPDQKLGLKNMFILSDSLELMSPATFSDGDSGSVILRLSLEGPKEEIKKNLYDTLLITGIVLIVGIFLSIFLAQIILQPLSTLTSATSRVARGSLDTKIDIQEDNEIGTLAQIFNHMVEKLRENEEIKARMHSLDKLASIGQLAAGIAHEVRNPLVSIQSLTELLREDYPAGSDGRKHIEVILSEVDRLNQVTEGLLNYARPSPAEPRELTVREIIDSINVLVQHGARKQGIAVEIESVSEIPVLANADRLTQAFLNIVMNAFQAMPEGGTLTIRLEAKGDFMEILFIDTGTGMDAETVSKAFIPFFTMKPGGTGLGLTIVREVIEEAGGKVELRSEPGKGTTVIVRLPGSNNSMKDSLNGEKKKKNGGFAGNQGGV